MNALIKMILLIFSSTIIIQAYEIDSVQTGILLNACNLDSIKPQMIKVLNDTNDHKIKGADELQIFGIDYEFYSFQDSLQPPVPSLFWFKSNETHSMIFILFIYECRAYILLDYSTESVMTELFNFFDETNYSDDEKKNIIVSVVNSLRFRDKIHGHKMPQIK